MRRLVYTCPDGQAIDSTMVNARIADAPSAGDPGEDPPEGPDAFDLKRNLDRHERRYIVNALRQTGGNRTEAARLLGISRNGLAIKMERLEIVEPEG
jgi:two-component system response regulator PilR (NtrC family)